MFTFQGLLECRLWMMKPICNIYPGRSFLLLWIFHTRSSVVKWGGILKTNPRLRRTTYPRFIVAYHFFFAMFAPLKLLYFTIIPPFEFISTLCWINLSCRSITQTNTDTFRQSYFQNKTCIVYKWFMFSLYID